MTNQNIYCTTSDKVAACNADFDMMVGNPWVNFEPEPNLPWYQDITQNVTTWFTGLNNLQLVLIIVTALFALMLVRHVRTFDRPSGRQSSAKNTSMESA